MKNSRRNDYRPSQQAKKETERLEKILENAL